MLGHSGSDHPRGYHKNSDMLALERHWSNHRLAGLLKSSLVETVEALAQYLAPNDSVSLIILRIVFNHTTGPFRLLTLVKLSNSADRSVICCDNRARIWTKLAPAPDVESGRPFDATSAVAGPGPGSETTPWARLATNENKSVFDTIVNGMRILIGTIYHLPLFGERGDMPYNK